MRKKIWKLSEILPPTEPQYKMRPAAEWLPDMLVEEIDANEEYVTRNGVVFHLFRYVIPGTDKIVCIIWRFVGVGIGAALRDKASIEEKMVERNQY